MSLQGAYDDANIFAKILRGEAPAVKVDEDEHTLTIMDVFPQSEGHVLVLPKAPNRNLLDADEATLAPLFAKVRQIALAVREALQPDGVVVTQFNGALAGQTVFHLHVHVIPRYADRPLGRHGEGMADAAELQRLAERISAAIRR